MPPSPALRCSPGREMSSDKHKRGRSFESGFLFKERADDDLALFNEVEIREKDNFLLQSSDDIDDAFSTNLKYFSEYKLGVHVPARGESSDLLNADGEKNDYDWLLTPPDTPLFPSLDDEPAPVSVAPRGRPRSQPISISRSSTMERSYKSSRGSPSPNRLSPSPRTRNTTISQPRGRPSSASSSSPTPSQRHVSPVGRPSPPSSKTVSPARRSSTPTSRRMSTVSTGTRGISPVKTNRGNSSSPKIRAWQSNFPGFSTEAPPNLRTSLADRPASYVRGSSPVSRTSRDSTSNYRRQSMSPTASRSASSSRSHDPSSHSKGSIASSGDDDLDSLHSIPVGSLDRFSTKRGGVISNNRSPILSKRPGRISSPSSVPKRSVDSAYRQMDNRKPPNMFRPLLSSVPSTTFYVGKASSAHHPLISRDSSVTNRSHISSDQHKIGAISTESEHNLDDLASEYGKLQDHDVQEELFPFEKGDEFSEDMGHKNPDESVAVCHDDLDSDLILESCSAGSIRRSHSDTVVVSVSPEYSHIEDDLLAVDSVEIIELEVCSQCGCQYQLISRVEVDTKICPDCECKNEAVTITHLENKIGACENSLMPSMQSSFVEVGSLLDVYPKPLATDICELNALQGEVNARDECDENSNTYSHENLNDKKLDNGNDQRTADQQGRGQASVDYALPYSHIKNQQLQLDSGQLDLNNNASESAGISILLSRSNSSKGHIVQGRTFTASASYDDMSFARESANSSRSSIGQSSASLPSSVLVRQRETHVHRQLSSCKSDLENYKSDLITRPLSRGSSFSGISSQNHSLGLQASTIEENHGIPAYSTEYSTVDKSGAAPLNQMLGLEDAEVEKTDDIAIIESKVHGEDSFRCNESSTTNPATSELSNPSLCIQLEDTSAPLVSDDDECTLCDEDFPNNAKSGLDREASARIPDSSFGEKHATTNSISEVDALKVIDGTLVTTLDNQAEFFCQSNTDIQNDEVSQNLEDAVDEYPESKIPSSTDKDLTSVSELNAGQANDAPEESTVMLEGHGRSKTKSLTLEEATDTILFCSSIVHDVAYQAVSIAMEKEDSEGIVGEPLEGFRPTVTMVEKSGSDRKYPHGGSTDRRNLKSRKPKQKRLGTDAKPISMKTENDENAGDPMTQNIGVPSKVDVVKPPPKLESKCNCTIM